MYSRKGIFAAAAALTLFGCGGSDDKQPDTPTPPAPQNQAPIIDLVTKMDVKERDMVEIEATLSDDGEIANIEWQQIAGNTLQLEATDTATLSVQIPNIAQTQTYTFSITVTDDEGSTTTQQVDVNAQAYAPLQTEMIADNALIQCLEDNNVDTGFTSVSCDGYTINNITGLEQLSELSALALTNAGLTTFPDMQAFTALEKVNFNGNPIGNIANLVPLNQLTSLSLDSLEAVEPSLSSVNLSSVKSLTLGCTSRCYNASLDLSQLNKESMIALDISGVRATNLSELKYFTSLEALSLNALSYDGSNLTSLSFLQHMPELKTLVLNNHYITDLSALFHTPKLTTLRLEGKVIDSFSALSHLAELQSLHIESDYGRQLASDDIETIAALNNLTSLTISGYRFDGARSFKQLTALEELALIRTNTSSIGFVREFSNLKALTLEGNSELNDISAIEGLNLTTLTLRNLHGLSYFDYIESLTHLRKLNISGGWSTSFDVATLKGLSNLEELSFSNIDLENTGALNQLVTLQSLQLSRTGLEVIPPLDNLEQLQSFTVQDNYELVDVTALDGLVNLENLIISDTKYINDVSFLTSLTKLKTLHLTRLPQLVYFLDAISELNALEKLNLSESNNLKCSELETLEQQQNINSIERSSSCLEKEVNMNAFSDPGLYQCIANHKQNYPNLLDSSKFSRISCHGNYEVKSLNGIEQFENLRRLNASTFARSLSGFDKLAKLTQLTHVDLSSSNNVLPLTLIFNALPNSVVGIDISNSTIIDFNGFKHIKENVKDLDVRSTNLSTVEPLMGLVHLDFLDLYDNDISCSDMESLKAALPDTYIGYFDCQQ
ncbi:hypothetical protein CWC31_14940 [Pseudoalteromonas ruthenica]|nr:hypothetical protein CWC31_14940 [Pseudoalteromonas ruthenica]